MIKFTRSATFLGVNVRPSKAAYDVPISCAKPSVRCSAVSTVYTTPLLCLNSTGSYYEWLNAWYFVACAGHHPEPGLYSSWRSQEPFLCSCSAVMRSLLLTVVITSRARLVDNGRLRVTFPLCFLEHLQNVQLLTSVTWLRHLRFF